MAEPRKLRVFLCHSSADRGVAHELYDLLSKQEWIDPWLNDERILPGHDRELEIKKAVTSADAVILGVSKTFAREEGEAQREFKFALDIALNKPGGSIFIIPIRVEECQLPPKLENLHFLDYFPRRRRGAAFQKLLASLAARANEVGIENEQKTFTSSMESSSQKKTKTAKTSDSGVPAPKIITSDAEFPIREIPFSRNRNFSGRKNVIDLIRNEFAKPQSFIPIYAITGLGGIGKTQIAIHYSHEYAKEYDLVWWIRSETDASLSADYQSLSNALMLPVKTKAEQMVFVNIVNNFLENTERKWLLVFDNVESQERIEKLLPKKGNGNILITSQSPDWGEIANDSHLIPFSTEEGREFLERRIREKDHEKSDKLTELLGGLPLSMEQACAFMSKGRTPIDIYVKLFEAQQEELWARESAPKDYHATLTTTWVMAFKQIRQIQPVAEDLLSVFSFFAPDGIPLLIFKVQADLLPENMRKMVLNPVELEECLAALYGYSLIERDGELISIHRLVQDVVRSRLSSFDLQKWLGLALEIAEKSFPYNEYDINSWFICAQSLPHALAVSSYAEKHSVGLEIASDIYQKVGEYLRDKAEYQNAAQIIERAVNIRQEILGNTHEKLGRSLSYFGEIQHEQAKFDDARKHYNLALEIFQAKSNAQTQYLARNLSNLGVLFQDQGNFENARKYYEQALAIGRTVLGENHPDTVQSLNNLGELFREQGDFENAKKYDEEALAIARTVLKENHPDTARSLNNRGALFADQGDFENARKYYEEALAIVRTVLGENHPNTAKSLSNLGTLFAEQGDFENARKYYEEALAIARTVLGENHPSCALTLNNIGGLLAQQSKYVEARFQLEQALSIYEKVHGKKHHHLINILSNLANTMFHLKLYPQARDYASRAIKICQEAKDKYAECEKIKQLQRSLPMAIGRRDH